MKRRDFLKVVGAGTAGAATAGCSTGEIERLIPYVVPSEDIVPGVPTWYASTCRECPAGCGIIVETHAGRATKVEGNPNHPVSHGNLCARGQASVQGLYHPDRFTGPFTSSEAVRRSDVSWGTAERLLTEEIQRLQAAGQGNGIVFLTQSYGGTMDRLADDFVAAIGGRRVVYDSFGDQPRDLDFENSDFIVSFGADFLETWGSPVDYAWQFAQMHSFRDGRRGKFVWVGPHRPLTGLNADEWVAPLPGTEHIFAEALAGGIDVATAARQTEVSAETIERLAGEFRAGSGVAMGPGASLTGGDTRRLRQAIDSLNGAAAPTVERRAGEDVARLVQQMQAGEVQMLLIDAPNPVYTLPGGLGFADAMERVPTRVSFSPFPDETALRCTMVLPNHHFLEAWGDYSPTPGVRSLVQPAMRPVFNTKQTGDVLLSVAAAVGVESVSPGVSATTYYDYLRQSWGGAGASAWRDAVKSGGMFPAAGETPAQMDVQLTEPIAAAEQGTNGNGNAAAVAATGFAAQQPQQTAATEQAPGAAPAAQPAAAAGTLEPLAFEETDGANFNLVVYPSYRFYDGRTANRPWLLELPDPVTKVSWQSWVEMHPRSAKELGVEQGDWVEVSSPYGSVRAPVYVYPGVRADTVAIQLGLGHEAFGRFSEGVGINPNRLLGATVDQATGDFGSYGLRVRVEPTGESVAFEDRLFEAGVRVQHDRELAQAISVTELARQAETGTAVIPGEDQHLEPLKGMGGFAPVPTDTDPDSYPPPGTHYGEYVEGATRWAMAIDLSRCIGCSACVTACYAENNIPVVGPVDVRKGRELAWLRIERYFGVSRDEDEAYTDEATDDVRFLPMLCQHCGNAPCEPVCPVYAAYHTPDGLNGQAYNRCVGTRYCANNCPYKVRVFNWYTYDFPEPLNWQLNPDVTVRDKGVMEKCTFCVQRIREKERNAALENRPVRDGEIVPACVQTCPTEVFVFGDIADENSDVARVSRSTRGYRALGVLNTQPAIVYLKKVTLHEPAHGGHHAATDAGHGAGDEAGTAAH